MAGGGMRCCRVWGFFKLSIQNMVTIFLSSLLPPAMRAHRRLRKTLRFDLLFVLSSDLC